MTAVALRLAGHDLRTAPARTVAVALLLTVVGLLPLVTDAPAAAGMVAAAALAAAATTGVIAAHERRAAILELNGSPAAAPALVAAVTIAVPALMATLAVWIVAALWAHGKGALATAGACLLTPVLVAISSPWWGQGRRPSLSRRWSKVAWVLGAIAVVPLAPIVALPLALAFVGRSIGREGPVAHALTTVAAAVLALLIALFIGLSEVWFDLALLLFFLGPVLIVCVARLGAASLDALSALVRPLGPRARLAAAPLQVRRRAVGPVVAVLAVVTALAAMDGTVGASFGRREERRRTTTVDYPGRAGSGPDQVIAAVTGADSAGVRLVAADVARRRGIEAIVIDGLGELTSTGFLQVGPTVALTDDLDPQGPTWVGVIEPAGLIALGFAELAPALEQGEVAVVNPTFTARARVTDSSGAGSTASLKARGLASPTTGVAAELPAAFVSPETAARVGVAVEPRRVVLVPSDTNDADPEALRQAALEIRAQLFGGGNAPSPGSSSDDPQELARALAAILETSDPVLAGDDPVEISPVGGELNVVPILSGTLDAARDKTVVLAALALLVTLAGAVLALGWTRAEDAVLDLQGASAGLRAALGAVQALILAGSASLVAAAVGIGLTALSFTVYNAHGRGDLPPIPLVVPTEVIVGLVLLPLVAAGLTALAVALRRGPDASTLQHDLAW